MKLEIFKEKNKKKTGIVMVTICCVFLIAGVFLYKNFELNSTEENFQDSEDVYLSFYVQDQISKTMPAKGTGYVFDEEKSTCTNGATISFDANTWSPIIKNISDARTKCEMHFKEKIPTAVDDIIELAKSHGDILAYDGTKDNNLRYIGASPGNYVSFNDEIWRVIGVMNNVDDGNGNKASRLKIIREDSIGEFEWDTSTNEWGQADLQDRLNQGVYYKNLTDEAKNMIDTVLWNIGNNGLNGIDGTPSEFYEWERSSNWKGQVGLMSPSDYGYSASGETSDRDCSELALPQWSYYGSCSQDSWLFDYDVYEGTWFLFPYSDSSSKNEVVVLYPEEGYITRHLVGATNRTIPVVYLKPDVRIVGGEGLYEDPFQLEL